MKTGRRQEAPPQRFQPKRLADEPKVQADQPPPQYTAGPPKEDPAEIVREKIHEKNQKRARGVRQRSVAYLGGSSRA